jgi:hypothetical protein
VWIDDACPRCREELEAEGSRVAGYYGGELLWAVQTRSGKYRVSLTHGGKVERFWCERYETLNEALLAADEWQLAAIRVIAIWQTGACPLRGGV